MGWVADRDYNASLNILRKSGLERPVAPVEPSTLGQDGGLESGSPARKGRVVQGRLSMVYLQIQARLIQLLIDSLL